MNTLETEGQMIQRVMPDLMGMKNILVFNDEAHHCCRKKPGSEEEVDDLKGDRPRAFAGYHLLKLYSRCTLLTSRELQVADYIRSGKTSKEIAEAMTISSRTVDIVRYSIRKKLGINNEKANLQAVLLSI